MTINEPQGRILSARLRGVGIAAIFVALANLSGAEAAVRVAVERSADGLELSWPGTVAQADGSIGRPYFELQRSQDLRLWQPVGERQRAFSGPAPVLGMTLAAEAPRAFYRLLSVPGDTVGRLGEGGAEVFGYGEAFARELGRIGQISPDQFAALFPSTANYLTGLSWDPTTAEFWDWFNTDPEVVNDGKSIGDHGYRMIDTRLGTEELEVLRQHGFVVSERLSASSFAEMFHDLWYSDLPVFVSTDALLQAWHRTYDAMLEEIEETCLFNSVQTILDGMAAGLASAASDIGNGALGPSLLDADYYLAVARSLLSGPDAPAVPSLLGQDARVAETLADIREEQLTEVVEFMGFCRMVDFSQFKVRGHYTHSDRLGRYFQCLMWLGRTDVPVAGGPFTRCPDDSRFATPRELGVAIVLWHLLDQSGQFATWADMERTIETFVGWSDSMTAGQLGGLLAGAGIRTLADVPDLATLERLQTDIASGALGVQNIRSDWFGQPLGGAVRYALPRTFALFGQKFVPDSWAFSQTVCDSIRWTENGATRGVPRRVPGALDVAFAMLGNDQIVPELVAQMQGTFQDPNRPHALTFRDGWPYQHNLAAVRAVMDCQTPEAWDGNIYLNWLGCLRELSSPTTDARYPEAMRTRAWAMKTLNTQLASWTQLRHDTILYAKQSYTFGGQCLYPKAFVEPRVEFWARLERMAERTAERIGALEFQGTYAHLQDDGETAVVPLTEVQRRQVEHLEGFASIVARLGALAAKELRHEQFNREDETFLDGLMEPGHWAGYMGPFVYEGWYPQLFYRALYWHEWDFHAMYGAGAVNTIVADVHTDVPVPNDPGSVLHEGVGRVNLLMIAVDLGAERFVCAGPVLSHYEFEVLGAPRRLSDLEWGGDGGWGAGILDGTFPDDVPPSRIEGLAPPVWTQGYLVPYRPDY